LNYYIIKYNDLCKVRILYKNQNRYFKTNKYQLIAKDSLVKLIPKNYKEQHFSLKEDEIFVDLNLKEGGITGILLDIKDAQKILNY
jgi:hypothetical protein